MCRIGSGRRIEVQHDRRIYRRALLGIIAAIVCIAPRAKSLAAGPAIGATSPVHYVELAGELEVRVDDYADFSRTLYFLRTAEGRMPLHFAENPPTNLQTGAHIRVRGIRKGSAFSFATLTTDVPILSHAASDSRTAKGSGPPPPPPGPLPNTFGAQSTVIILVNFQDDPTNQPYTVADTQSAVFGTSSNFFLENSYQQTWLTGTVVGWFTIPVNSTNCDTSSIATYAQSAASAAGVNLSAYTHYVYAFPQNNACGWAGSSFIGGNPAQSWLNGSVLNVHIVDHELGHQLGLYHSHSLDCGTGVTIGSNCNVIEYGDILDTIGAPQTPSPHFNAFQKERLGWLNYGASPSIKTVQTAGTYLLNAYELGGAGPNALKILKSTDPATGTKTWYYLEARQAIGFDGFISSESSENETDGVLLHIGTDGNGNTSDLLDMTPATPAYYWWFDPSLAVGQSFQDPASGLTLTTSWVTSTEAAVTVQFSGAVSVATAQPSYSRGQTVSVTATAASGGSPVGNATVKFTVTKANGAVITGSATTSANGTAAYSMRLKSSDPVGTYQVGAATMLNGVPSNAATTFTVQ
jgi:hypothetical protein